MASKSVLPHRNQHLLLVICVGFVIACAGDAHGQKLWGSYGGSPGGGHYSPLTQVTPANVSDLELAWEHRSGDFRVAREGVPGSKLGDSEGPRPQSAMQVTPIVVGDTLYYCTPFNRVFALDAATGRERWRYDPGVDTDPIVLTNCRGVSSWKNPTPGGQACDHRIFTGTLDGRLIALDGATGKPCEDFGNGGQLDLREGLGDHIRREYGITSPPAILGNLVITGAMVLDNRRTNSPGGVVRAFDARSGELQWSWDPLPPEAKPELTDAGQRYQKGTTNVWSIISVDPGRNLVFVPTGNTSPDYYGGLRGTLENGLDYYSSSVVALDGSNGKVVWHFQAVHHDLWDYDTPSQPTLFEAGRDGKTIPALAQPTKMGHLFLLNRETGEPLFPVEERPVPAGDVPGEYYAPTQPFPTVPESLVAETVSAETAWGITPWEEDACREKISAARWQGIFTPPSVQGTIAYPFQGGGNNWGSPAVDPQRKIIVLRTNHVAGIIHLIPRAQCDQHPTAHPQEGTPFCVTPDVLLSPWGLPCTAPPWNTLDAIDLTSGQKMWSVPLGTSRDMAPFPFWFFKGTPGIGGPAVTGSGLIFIAGSGDHYFRAFSTITGEELWRTRMPTGSGATPMTYLAPDGRQMVVIAAGSHWGSRSGAADHLLAYALPRHMTPATTTSGD
ncbi:MAG: pyrroloquinoline quinone-dependent dehydrogenase [Pseudomonadales bacterium]|nr:pyrroloquinoline quinone-dependent dehydrogenase [Pseudomonadales bacterium]